MAKISTAKQVEAAPTGTHSLGGGLMLIVGVKARCWIVRVQHEGKRRDVGLGAFATVTLAEARLKAEVVRGRAKQGVDVVAEKRKPAQTIPTFREIAALVIADAKAKSVNEKVRYQWDRHLGEPYAGPLLDLPVNQITTLDVMRTLAPIWHDKPEVARKVYPAIRRVFDRARIVLRDGFKIDLARNPADWRDLRASGLEKPKELSRGRHPSLAYAQLPEFIAALREREAVAARALEFLILTGVRTAAVLSATWDQFDLANAVWTVPLAALKDRKHRTEAFRVPLSSRALAILAEMKPLGAKHVFPGQTTSTPLSNMAMLTLLQRMNHGETPRWTDPADKRPITAHGFRASLKTWAQETATFPHAVVETALGHTVGGKVERAYSRTDLLEQRRALMDAWAHHCEPGARRTSSSFGARDAPTRRAGIGRPADKREQAHSLPRAPHGPIARARDVMQSDTPFVGIWRAVQLIAEMLPGGKAHAEAMTEGAVKRGFAHFYAPGSVELTAFQTVADILHSAVASPSVNVSVASDAGRRAIADYERAFRLDLRSGLLADPNGATRLRGVTICVADLRKLARDIIDPPIVAGNAETAAESAADHRSQAKPSKLKDVARALKTAFPAGRPAGLKLELLVELAVEKTGQKVSPSTLKRALPLAWPK